MLSGNKRATRAAADLPGALIFLSTSVMSNSATAIVNDVRLRLADLRATGDPHVLAIATECEEVLAEIEKGLDALASQDSPAKASVRL
jgi:hypothetical protein